MVRGFEIPFEIPFNHSHGGRPARPAGGARLATPGLQASTWNPPPMSTPTFAEQLALLPPISHLAAVELLDAAGTVVATLANRPGTAGSAAVYHALAARHGAITPEAAREGLALYAEHTADARAFPGKHPNIDRLVDIEAGRLAPLTVRLQPAAAA